MGVLMIQCPSTGREVSTGIEMLDVEQLPAVKATTRCPACGRVHEWTKHDAWLADGGHSVSLLHRALTADTTQEGRAIMRGPLGCSAISVR